MAEISGAKIKKIRLEKGISLEEVHKKTKIHISILKAIEGDGLTNLSAVYLKGFLKVYCAFLGVSPEECSSEEKAEKPKKHSFEAQAKKEGESQGRQYPSFSQSISLKLGSLGIGEKLRKFLPLIVVAIMAAALFGLLKMAGFGKKKAEGPSAAAVASYSPPAAQEQKKEPLKKEAVSGIRLGLRATDNSWVYLKSDGKVVFKGILKKGSFETWSAEKKMVLSLGNAGAVELEVNGEKFDKLGRKGQAVKNILITEEGMKVGK